MHAVIRSAGAQINLVVGPMVALIGVAALLTGVVLSIVLETAWFLMFLIPAAMGLGAGLLLLRGARRSRLQIDPEGFTWCGFAGAEQSLRWQEIHQLLPPPPASRRVVAIAQLRDGRQVEVRALWESPISPAVLRTTAAPIPPCSARTAPGSPATADARGAAEPAPGGQCSTRLRPRRAVHPGASRPALSARSPGARRPRDGSSRGRRDARAAGSRRGASSPEPGGPRWW